MFCICSPSFLRAYAFYIFNDSLYTYDRGGHVLLPSYVSFGLDNLSLIILLSADYTYSQHTDLVSFSPTVWFLHVIYFRKYFWLPVSYISISCNHPCLFLLQRQKFEKSSCSQKAAVLLLRFNLFHVFVENFFMIVPFEVGAGSWYPFCNSSSTQ